MYVYVSKGLSEITTALRKEGKPISKDANHLIILNLFMTITNANFDEEMIKGKVKETLAMKKELLGKLENSKTLSEAALWRPETDAELLLKGETVGVSNTDIENRE